MIDMNKKYTSGGKPVRIYADGSDTWCNKIHGARLNSQNTWASDIFEEKDLVEAWQPKEGEVIWVWDKTTEPISVFVRRFLRINEEGKCIDTHRVSFNFYAKFTGELPEAFKGL